MFSDPASVQDLWHTKYICFRAFFEHILSMAVEYLVVERISLLPVLTPKNLTDLWMWQYPIKNGTKQPLKNSILPHIDMISCTVASSVWN